MGHEDHDHSHEPPEIDPTDAAAALRTPLPDPKVEWLEANIMLMRGVLGWSDDLIRVAEEVGKFLPTPPQRKDDPERASDDAMIAGGESPRLERFDSLFCQAVGFIKQEWDKSYPGCLARLVPSDTPMIHDEGYLLMRYRVGQYYRQHVNSYPMTSYAHPAWRQVSIMGFPLGQEFSGGEVRFGRHRITIEPEPGTLLSFPSGVWYPYEEKAVRTGTKYVLMTHLH